MKIALSYDISSQKLVSDNGPREKVSMKDPFSTDEKLHSPTEFLLMAMGGCSSDDVIVVLSKKKKRIDRFHCEVEGERETEDPKTLKKANISYFIDGDVDEASARRAINLSLTKYCSVSILAKRGGAELTYSLILNGKKLADQEKPA